MTLALLLTAATGAWADNVEAKIGTTEYATLGAAISSAQDGDIIQLQSDAALTEQIIVEKRITIDYNGYIISRVGNTYGGIFWNVDMTFTDSDDTGRGGIKCFYGSYTGSNAKAKLCGGRYDDSAETILTGSFNIPTGYEIVNINADGSADADGFISRVVRNYLNDTKTEASFEMPTSDVYVSYELVRDMSVQMTAQVGDGTQEQPRYRVKKDGTNWIPADLQPTDIPGLFSVIDGIENNKVLTQTTDYIVKIYAIDEQGQPTGEPMTFTTFTFEPGIYAVKAVAAQGSDYDGETALSNTFKLYDYINITFPKGYSTHYYNESLVLDEIRDNLKFYAVTAVTSEKVTLTEIEGKAIPGGTPFIVYNETAEPITAVMGMLQADDVTSAEQFKGTAEDKIMGSQSNCYILRNGDSTPTFRLVEGAGKLPAHRCYIDLGAVACTRSLGFDFGDGTTGIDSVESGELKVDSYYDLNGRKLQGNPTKKGIYIHNGKKVVVK